MSLTGSYAIDYNKYDSHLPSLQKAYFHNQQSQMMIILETLQLFLREK